MRRWQSWSDLPYALYNDYSCSEFMKNEVSVPRLSAMYARGLREDWPPARMTDIWRIAFLYERGGLYVDVDAQPSAPYASLIQDVHDFRCPYSHELVNWFIYSRYPRHPILAAMINVMLQREDEEGSVIYKTGPEALTTAYQWAVSSDQIPTDRKATFVYEKGLKPFSWLYYPILFKYWGYTQDVRAIREEITSARC